MKMKKMKKGKKSHLKKVVGNSLLAMSTVTSMGFMQPFDCIKPPNNDCGSDCNKANCTEIEFAGGATWVCWYKEGRSCWWSGDIVDHPPDASYKEYWGGPCKKEWVYVPPYSSTEECVCKVDRNNFDTCTAPQCNESGAVIP